MPPMTLEDAWKLVNGLTDAARRHEAAMLGNEISSSAWNNAVEAELRLSREIVQALTGKSSTYAECSRPSFLTGLVPTVADAVVGPDPYGEAAGASIDHALTRVA